MKPGSTCYACHDAATCGACHKTPMPHPTNWVAVHTTGRVADIQDCYRCHVDRAACQSCHHKTLRGAELVAENCVKCHPTITTKPLSALKDRGLAEHAAHLQVAKAKGAPFRCETCHVDFVLSSQAPMATQTQGHDTTLCFSCHGATDSSWTVIAPYPCKALCIRCHK